MKTTSIAHIVTRFPSISETFVVSDISAMKKVWAENHIFSYFKEEGVVPEWIREVHYFSLFDFHLASNLHFFKESPLKYFSILKCIIVGHWPKKKELLKALATWPSMVHAAHVVKEKQIDAVHAHWANIPSTTAFVISKLLNTPLTCTGHAHDLYKFNAFLHEILKNCSLFLTSTQYNKQHLLSTYPDIDANVIKVYSHGVDIQKLSPGPTPEKSPFVIASIGRMTWQKGFDTLLMALRKLLDEGLNVRLDFLALPGHLSDEINDLAKDLNVNEAINWLPKCSHDQIINIYRNAHLFVLPCEVGPHGDRDGIPNVILEASACGIPCVSTFISGVPEAVLHEKTGLLVEPKDVDSLSKAIKRLYNDEPLRLTLGKAARAHIKNNYNKVKCQEEIVTFMEAAHG